MYTSPLLYPQTRRVSASIWRIRMVFGACDRRSLSLRSRPTLFKLVEKHSYQHMCSMRQVKRIAFANFRTGRRFSTRSPATTRTTGVVRCRAQAPQIESSAPPSELLSVDQTRSCRGETRSIKSGSSPSDLSFSSCPVFPAKVSCLSTPSYGSRNSLSDSQSYPHILSNTYAL